MSFKKIYLEITNVCNLRCSFCPGTQRPAHFLSPEEFSTLTEKLRGAAPYLYFHLMGEPLLHPQLAELLHIAEERGFYVNLTTNGTLLPAAAEALLCAPNLHRVNVSLQSFEGNGRDGSLSDYVNSVAAFAEAAAQRGTLVSLRLWNGGGAAARNGEILAALQERFPAPWRIAQKNTVLRERVFLEFGTRFDWPAPEAAARDVRFCYALRDQLGVLCDGTVVPCCLDSEGRLALGNLFTQDLDEILQGARAQAILRGFSQQRCAEDLCRRCGFANRF